MKATHPSRYLFARAYCATLFRFYPFWFANESSMTLLEDDVSGIDSKKEAGHMTARQYMIRNVFLESVRRCSRHGCGHASPPPFQMRRMKRDNGWIETLLEESFNERMHLTHIPQNGGARLVHETYGIGSGKVCSSTPFSQHISSPHGQHIDLLDSWKKRPSSPILGSFKTWTLVAYRSGKRCQLLTLPSLTGICLEGHRTMRDLLLYIRADESKHREVNHTLANLDQKLDPNPYNSKYKSDENPHPVKDLRHQKPTGWEREEVI